MSCGSFDQKQFVRYYELTRNTLVCNTLSVEGDK